MASLRQHQYDLCRSTPQGADFRPHDPNLSAIHHDRLVQGLGYGAILETMYAHAVSALHRVAGMGQPVYGLPIRGQKQQSLSHDVEPAHIGKTGDRRDEIEYSRSPALVMLSDDVPDRFV
jgi:hypothetical protein